MTPAQPLTAVRLAGFVWLLLAPLVWLGAALSKMGTTERYNIQLGLATLIALCAVAAGVAAFKSRGWARPVLLSLSWSAAVFWVYSGVALSTRADISVLPIVIGVCFVALAALLHIDAPAVE